MNREIETYINQLEASLRKSSSAAAKEKLFRLHTQKLTEFQSERHIHLLVTLFFGVVTILSYVLLLFTFGKAAILAGLLSILLTTLEGAYVLHYYRLENGIQKLYSYTNKLAR